MKNKHFLIPKLQSDKDCMMCGRCKMVCPKNAITFSYGSSGQLYPVVDENKCIKCKKCESACLSRLNPIGNGDFQTKYFAAYNVNREEYDISSSGGIFSLASKYVISELHGVVIGAVFDPESYQIVHTLAETMEEVSPMRKSKYVQSNWIRVNSQIEEYLNKGRVVLFSGLPCQTETLRWKYGENDKLILCDLFCHGVAGGKFFDDYLHESFKAKQVTKVDFRWQRNNEKPLQPNYYLKIENSEGEILNEFCNENTFYRLFINSSILKGSCFSCPYASFQHSSDLILGDFDKPEFIWENGKIDNSGKRISIIGCNTAKGNQIFEYIKKDLKFYKIENNETIESYYIPHENTTGEWGYNAKVRERFLLRYRLLGFSNAIKIIETENKIKYYFGKLKQKFLGRKSWLGF